MKERIRFMYEEGDTGMMNMLFSSKSMADFVNNAYYVSTISEYDRKMLQEYEAAKRAVEDKQEELAAKEKELKDLQADRGQRQQDHRQETEVMAAHGQQHAEYDPGERERERAQPHRAQTGFRVHPPSSRRFPPG